HLKRLDLGFENRWPRSFVDNYISEIDGEEYMAYEGPTPDTLDLSLESGLYQLEALRDLEMFGFEAIDHRISKREVEWMARSWPKLKLVYGLAKDCLYKLEPDMKKEN
ncbi:hypothetical protein BGZ65_012046, partial [Modicella reniformis]